MAGAAYHVGGHFYVSSLDPMVSPAWVVLQFFFKDAGGNTLATFASPQIGTNFRADTWTFLQSQTEPPAWISWRRRARLRQPARFTNMRSKAAVARSILTTYT